MSSWPSFGCWWDLTTERLWDLQRDFVVLQDEMVTAYAMLGSLLHRWNYSNVRSNQVRVTGAISPRRRLPCPEEGQGLESATSHAAL